MKAPPRKKFWLIGSVLVGFLTLGGLTGCGQMGTVKNVPASSNQEKTQTQTQTSAVPRPQDQAQNQTDKINDTPLSSTDSVAQGSNLPSNAKASANSKSKVATSISTAKPLE